MYKYKVVIIFSTTIRSSEELEEQPVKTYICEKRL